MLNQKLLPEFTETLRVILFNDNIELATDTELEDIEGWDPFGDVSFIAAVKHDSTFNVADVESFRSVGDVVAKTQELLGCCRCYSSTDRE